MTRMLEMLAAKLNPRQSEKSRPGSESLRSVSTELWRTTRHPERIPKASRHDRKRHNTMKIRDIRSNCETVSTATTSSGQKSRHNGSQRFTEDVADRSQSHMVMRLNCVLQNGFEHIDAQRGSIEATGRFERKPPGSGGAITGPTGCSSIRHRTMMHSNLSSHRETEFSHRSPVLAAGGIAPLRTFECMKIATPFNSERCDRITEQDRATFPQPGAVDTAQSRERNPLQSDGGITALKRCTWNHHSALANMKLRSFCETGSSHRPFARRCRREAITQCFGPVGQNRVQTFSNSRHGFVFPNGIRIAFGMSGRAGRRVDLMRSTRCTIVARMPVSLNVGAAFSRTPETWRSTGFP